MKILFLSHQWINNSHHSLYSGFKRIITFAAEKNDVTLITWGKEEAEHMEGKIRVITVKGSGKDYFFTKRMAISRRGREIAKDFDVVHSITSDSTFFLERHRFTVTFHVLPGVVKYHETKEKLFLFLKYHIIQKRAIRRAKNIGCVSTNLLEGIPEKYRSKAHFIPHGVDTEFWDPAQAKAPVTAPAGNYVLCVGAHGLDRTLMAEFVKANPSLPFVFVGLRNKLEDLPNAHYLYNISNEELRNLYAHAFLAFRPLEFATANNAILEALAMGKTNLANRIPGVTDYLTDETCIFIDTLKDRKLDNIGDRLLDPVALRQNAISSFSWNKVLDDYFVLYLQKEQHG